MRAGGVAWTDLATTLGTDQRQFRTAGRAGGVILADGSAAFWAEGLFAGGALWRARRDTIAAARTDSARLESAAQAGGFLGEEHQVALGTDARVTFWAGTLRWCETGAASRTDCPTHEQCPHALG